MALLPLTQRELLGKVSGMRSVREGARGGTTVWPGTAGGGACPGSPLWSGMGKQERVFLEQRPIHFPLVVTFVKGDTRFPSCFSHSRCTTLADHVSAVVVNKTIKSSEGLQGPVTESCSDRPVPA